MLSSAEVVNNMFRNQVLNSNAQFDEHILSDKEFSIYSDNAWQNLHAHDKWTELLTVLAEKKN